MYIPSDMAMGSLTEAHDFIDEYGFGIIVSQGLQGSHLPFLINRSEGEKGTLYSHCAKANPLWEAINGEQVLMIFHGPHAYISPTWYASSPAVPTWNYAAVHAYGVAQLLGDAETLEIVERTTEKYEPSLLTERKIMTEEFCEKLLSGIVGFKISISDIEGKLKLGQNRKPGDQKGVVAGLKASADHDAQGLVNYMRKKNIGLGD